MLIIVLCKKSKGMRQKYVHFPSKFACVTHGIGTFSGPQLRDNQIKTRH